MNFGVMLASFVSLCVIWGQLHCFCVSLLAFNKGMIVIL